MASGESEWWVERTKCLDCLLIFTVVSDLVPPPTDAFICPQCHSISTVLWEDDQTLPLPGKLSNSPLLLP